MQAPDLREMQQTFLGHLLGQQNHAADYIQSTAQVSADERLDVYANAYRLRLKEALETDYEKLHIYLGDELFDQLLEAYIDRFPSHVTSLRDYSAHMSELLKTLSPYCDVPVLLELERIEHAFNQSFDAKDSQALPADALSAIPPENWPTMRFAFQASLNLLKNEYNSFPIWQALADEQIPPPAEQDPAVWLVWRKDLVSRFRTLSDVEHQALKIALSGGNFGELCEALLEYFAEDEVPVQAVTLLQTWIQEEMLAEIQHG